MSVWELFGASEVAPFAIALGLLIGLTLLELVAALFGASLLGAGGEASAPDAPEIGADVGPDVAPELGVDPTAPELTVDAGGADAGAAAASGGGMSGALAWLGVGKAPFMTWLAVFLAAFGLSGAFLQAIAADLLGAPAPVLAALAIATPLGLLAAKTGASALARLLPKVQTSAVQKSALGGRLGVVTGPEGRRGRPTEAKVKDPYGRAHYLSVEPFEDDVVLQTGQEIIVLRRPLRGIYFAVAYDGPGVT